MCSPTVPGDASATGGTKDCDHWHQGAGFVTSHMALTLMYEQSLQAVNPAVTVPYWDFTLESTFFGASDFRSSGVFADDWFGEADTDNVSTQPVLEVGTEGHGFSLKRERSCGDKGRLSKFR